MKSNITRCALLAALILAACENAADWSGVPAGKGLVRIEAGFGAAGANSVAGVSRTVFPSMTGFGRWEYLFAKDGGEAEERTPVSDGLFELEAGQYTVTVNAFVGEETEPAAEGTSDEFTVTAGAETPAVTVTLVVADAEEGEGTLSFTLNYPDGAGLDSFTLTPLSGGDSIDLKALGSEADGVDGGPTFSGTESGVNAGCWLARVTLSKGGLHTGKSEVVHIYGSLTTELNWTFSGEAFTAIPVLSGEDSGPGTLREAIERVNAADGGGTIFIKLPGTDRVITLESPLPEITKNLTVNGNGATLTQNGITTGDPLLKISGTGAVVNISRLHFKGGQAVNGGAIYNTGSLTLESCIFSDNQISGNGGAVHTTGALTVLGCTFYSNSAVSGGAIYNSGGTVTVTGNIFYGNTATSGNVVYGTATSGGYNVSDKAAGADGSGYAAADDDKFSVTELPISPDDFKPVEDGGAAGLLPDSLPEGYPALDFYGEPVAAGGQAGAAQDLSAAASGFYLTYNVNNDAYGTVELTAGTADEDGSYTSGASVTLNATAKEIAGYTVSFSHWTVNGTEAGSTNPFTFTMDADKVVQAVFSATPLGTAPIELAFDDGGTLISGNTENLTVDKSEGQPLTVTAAAGLTAIQWSLNGVEIPAPRGTEKTITINAANYPAGKYLLGLAAKKDGVDYSAVVTFTVVE